MNTKKRITVLCACIGILFAILLNGCSNPKSISDDSTSITVDYIWSFEMNCSACHTIQNASLTDNACLAFQHQELDCVDCHQDPALEVIHTDATPGGAKQVEALEDSIVEESVCLSCHDKKDTLVTETADSQLLQDKNGLVVNPHDLPKTAGHADISCQSCHKMHDYRTAKTSGPNLCISCHHSEVYECKTCHS